MKKFLENNKKKIIIGTSAAALFSVLLGAIYLNSNNKEVKGNKVCTVETKKEDKKETEKPKTEVKKETEKPKIEAKKEVVQPKKEVEKPKTEVKKEVIQPKKEVKKPKTEVKKENITKKEVIQPKKEVEKPKTEKLIPGTWRFEGGFAIYAESENLETYYSMEVGNSGKVFETVAEAKEYGFEHSNGRGFLVDELYYNGKIMYTVNFKPDTLRKKNNDLSLEVKK